MPKLVCSTCQLEYVIKKTGVHVVEYAAFGPYKLWEADEWMCPGCGSTLCAGFSESPLSVHYMADFQETLDRFIVSHYCRYDFENKAQKDKYSTS